MDKNTNLRNMKMDPSMGKDVRDSSTLGGTASKTPAQRETNETKQYVNSGSGSAGAGTLGGKAKFD